MQEYRGKDIIEITQKQLDLIMAWRDMNKDIVRKFLPFISNGTLRIKQENCANEIAFLIFQNKENSFLGYFDYFCVEDNGENKYLYSYTALIQDGKVYVKDTQIRSDYSLFYKENQEDALLQDLIGVFFAVNAYFFHYKQDMDEIPVKEVKKHTVHNKRKEPLGTTTVRSLSVKYRLKGSVRHERVPKARQWHVDYWGVRGHIRHYKSGKTVFIAPYTKGKDRENAIGKTKVYTV